MNKESTFVYNYSAKQNKEVENIRNRYLPHEESELEQLKKLDSAVKQPADVFAYVFGSISAVIMGSGMSLIMTDISDIIGLGDPMVPGVVIGVIGMMMAIINYPIYKGILGSRRKKYANKIIALSDKIMKG